MDIDTLPDCDIEAFLAESRNYETISDWELTTNLNETANAYYEMMEDYYTPEQWRQHYQRAPLEEKLEVHENMNLEYGEDVELTHRQFNVLNEQFNVAHVSTENFGRALLGLPRSKLDYLLMKAGLVGTDAAAQTGRPQETSQHAHIFANMTPGREHLARDRVVDALFSEIHDLRSMMRDLHGQLQRLRNDVTNGSMSSTTINETSEFSKGSKVNPTDSDRDIEMTDAQSDSTSETEHPSSPEPGPETAPLDVQSVKIKTEGSENNVSDTHMLNLVETPFDKPQTNPQATSESSIDADSDSDSESESDSDSENMHATQQAHLDAAETNETPATVPTPDATDTRHDSPPPSSPHEGSSTDSSLHNAGNMGHDLQAANVGDMDLDLSASNGSTSGASPNVQTAAGRVESNSNLIISETPMKAGSARCETKDESENSHDTSLSGREDVSPTRDKKQPSSTGKEPHSLPVAFLYDDDTDDEDYRRELPDSKTLKLRNGT